MGACDWPARGRRLFGIEAIHCLQKPFLPKPLPKFGDAIQGPSLPTIRLLKHHDVEFAVFFEDRWGSSCFR